MSTSIASIASQQSWSVMYKISSGIFLAPDLVDHGADVTHHVDVVSDRYNVVTKHIF